ncbi:MAG: pyridoxal-phosphate dependent enzyme [Candidatus Bathyarchaeota archaeon]|nr:MAG: pyridoxal-phosphate dependent enzyme [Candidatus Bathyarchaeota archaeon]
MEFEIRCSKCGRISSSVLDFRCFCCSPFETRLDFHFEKEKIHNRNRGLLRYMDFFPYVKDEEIISLGEGWTPLIKPSKGLHFKLDYLNPTGSFKDRGSTALISALNVPLKDVRGYVSEDSSGNAGASIAAYAACAQLKAKIYVPESVSGQKLNQIRFYGAEVVKVSGGRSEVAAEAQKNERRKFYVGHILHPLFRDGIRCLAYELAEQLEWRLPDIIYLPVSAGTLLLGIIDGLKHLEKSGLVGTFPRIVACQTRQVSPLHHRFRGLDYTPPERITSIADALVSVNPPLLDLMTKSLKDSNGSTVLVEEHEIFNAFLDLGRKGFFVEPSSAVAYAGYQKQFKARETSKCDEAVVILTGNGLKSSFNSARGRPCLKAK